MIEAYGRLSTAEDSPAATANTVFWLASCTKLLTSIAALQCVERGLLGLDDSDIVEKYWPEAKRKQVLLGFDCETGRPMTRPTAGRITLRHLLTHTSGLGYDFWPPLSTWQDWHGQPCGDIEGGLDQLASLPLEFDPGTSWIYGAGLEVVGRILELTTGLGLHEYCQQYIFAPLGIESMCLGIQQRPDMAARRMPTSIRPSPTSKLQQLPESSQERTFAWASGGAAAFATAPDFLKILKSLLRNDGRLLSLKYVDLMFQPQMTDTSGIEKTMNHPGVSAILAPGMGLSICRHNYALAGSLYMDDIPGRFRAGTMRWGGLPRQRWWIDRASGTCGFFATMLMPADDRKSEPWANFFEEEVMRRFGSGPAPGDALPNTLETVAH